LVLTGLVIVLLDPLPSFMEKEEVEESTYLNGRRTHVKEFPLRFVPAYTPLAARTPVVFPANKFKASDDQIQALRAQITTAGSTSADMESWIWQENKNITTGSKDPLLALLRLAYIDTVEYLDHLGWTLDEISRDSLDESIITTRLSAWRKLLKDLEIEIPALGHNLRSFMDPGNVAYAEAEVMLNDLDKRIPKFLDTVRAVHTALSSEMALLDSSRGITEARSMARLTELAFVFVPLTFVSGLFSMQVVELEAGVSLWVFVLAALGLGVFTYATRSLLQSDVFGVLGRRAQESPFVSGQDPASQGASNALIVKYVAISIWRHREPTLNAMVFLAVLAMPVVPIAFMWSRNDLDVGLHAVLTLLIFPPGIAVACFATSAFEALTRSDELENEPGCVKLSFYEQLGITLARAREMLPHLAASSSDSESSGTTA
jgi:hypothetical protein